MKEEVEICSECKNSNLSYDPTRGEWCCLECGLIVRDKALDQAGGIKQKHGEPKYPVKGITYGGKPGSYIGYKNIDSAGNKISPHTLSTINRIRRWHYDVRNPGERRAIVAMGSLYSLLRQLDVKRPVKIEANTILHKLLKKTSLRIGNFEALAAAVIYITCKIKKVPKSMEEISKIASVNKKTIYHYCKLLLNTLEIKIIPLDLVKYIPKISGKLGISRKSQLLAEQLLKKAKENGLASGKKPAGLVIAALYLACKQNGEKITQQSLAKTADVAGVTLRARYKELKILQ